MAGQNTTLQIAIRLKTGGFTKQLRDVADELYAAADRVERKGEPTDLSGAKWITPPAHQEQFASFNEMQWRDDLRSNVAALINGVRNIDGDYAIGELVAKAAELADAMQAEARKRRENIV